MDWNKLTTGNKIGLVGGVVLIIALFLPWYGVLGVSISAFDAGFLAWFGTLVAIAGAVLLALKAFGTRNVEAGNLRTEQLAFLLGAAGAVLILLRWLTETSFVRWGLFVALAAAAATAFGAFTAMKEAGLSMPSADDFKSIGGDSEEGGEGT